MSKIISDANLAALIADEHLTKELLGVHLKNDRKIELFYSYFIKFTVGGTFKYDLCFSWYGFFGNIFYFLYRKLYLPTLMFTYVIAPGIFICASIVVAIMAFISGLSGGGAASEFIIALLTLASFILPCVAFAMAGIYLYIKKFLRDLELSGFGELDVERVKENLSLLGGSNEWTVTAFVISMIGLGVYLVIYLPIYFALMASGFLQSLY